MSDADVQAIEDAIVYTGVSRVAANRAASAVLAVLPTLGYTKPDAPTYKDGYHSGKSDGWAEANAQHMRGGWVRVEDAVAAIEAQPTHRCRFDDGESFDYTIVLRHDDVLAALRALGEGETNREAP